MRGFLLFSALVYSISSLALTDLEKNCSLKRDDGEKCCKRFQCASGPNGGSDLQATIDAGIHANGAVPSSLHGTSQTYGNLNATMRDAYQTLGMLCQTKADQCEATCRMAKSNAKVATVKTIMGNLHDECANDFKADVVKFNALFEQYAAAAAGGKADAGGSSD